MMWLNKLRKSEKGQSMVEFALILPLIVVILFGILEFGRIFHAYLTITNAAREGARVAVVGKSDIDIIDRIGETAPLPNADKKLYVTKLYPNQSARTPGVPVVVEVTYSLDLVTPLFSNILPNPMTLRAQATMRME